MKKFDSFQICIIGAGLSGLCAAIQLKRKLQNVTDFTVYESNDEVGGCWLTNSYPGSACSIPSQLYSYSFASKPDWSQQYAERQEILEYLKSVAIKFEIYKNIKFNYQVKRLTWIENLKKWNVLLLNQKTSIESEMVYDIIINGSGQLRIPEKPKEFEVFQGATVHTAEWNESLELEGKTVAVIGSGPTAVQLIPSIAKKVTKLLAYQRNPIWMARAYQFCYPEIIKSAFANVPGLLKLYRSLIFIGYDMVGSTVVRPGPLFNQFVHFMTESLFKLHSRIKLGSAPELRKLVTPSHPLLCKVPGSSDDYYSTLKLSNVELITNKIIQVCEKSIITEDGREEAIDVIILATGFRTQDFFSPMEIIGKDSQNILFKWKTNGPSAYLGITSSDMPNHFILMGPGTAFTYTSFIFQIECQVHFIIQVLKEMMKRNANVVSIKESVELEYNKKMEKSLKKTVYGQPDCINLNSWFMDSRLVNVGIYPKSCCSYWKRTRSVDDSKFNFD